MAIADGFLALNLILQLSQPLFYIPCGHPDNLLENIKFLDPTFLQLDNPCRIKGKTSEKTFAPAIISAQSKSDNPKSQ
jgi:hypothetical protein